MVVPGPKLNAIHINFDIVVYLLIQNDFRINWRVVTPRPQLNTIHIKYDLIVNLFLQDDYRINWQVMTSQVPN